MDHPLAASLNCGTVLLVDDDELVRRALQRLMRNYPITLLCAPSVEAADLVLDGQTPHVIVLDLHFPQGMNGLDGIAYFKRKFPQAAIFIFTGHYDRDVDSAASRRGARQVFDKASEYHWLIFETIFWLGRASDGGRPMQADHAYLKTCSRLGLRTSASNVLHGVLGELEDKQIAAAYGLGRKTVQYHVRNLKRLSGAKTRVGVVKRVLLG